MRVVCVRVGKGVGGAPPSGWGSSAMSCLAPASLFCNIARSCSLPPGCFSRYPSLHIAVCWRTKSPLQRRRTAAVRPPTVGCAGVLCAGTDSRANVEALLQASTSASKMAATARGKVSDQAGIPQGNIQRYTRARLAGGRRAQAGYCFSCKQSAPGFIEEARQPGWKRKASGMI